MFLVTLALLALLVATIWLYSNHRHSYWAKRGIPSPPTVPLFGNLTQVLSTKRGRWVFDNEVHRKYSKNGLGGIYGFFSPTLCVSDPDLIKHIFVKDFEHFTDRRVFKSPNERDRIMNDMLSNENGEKWRALRSIMTPTFTSGKMRSMFHLVCQKADALVAFSLAEAQKKPSVDMKYNFGRFTIDTIASCAFGLECNSLVNEDAMFPKMADPFFDFGLSRMMKFILFSVMPNFIKRFGMRLFPEETEFFKRVSEETLAARRKGIKRGDFLDLLLDAQNSEDVSDKSKKRVMDDDTIKAQCILFIIAGYDTTATTLAFASFLLATNPSAQRRLRQELQDVIEKHDGITYQGIMEAKYLDSCLQETLRLYPPAPMLERLCSKDYLIPGTNIKVEKGQTVQVSTWSMHHDEKYWPEPESFKPERFLPENKEELHHYTYMPFGLGPRNCIAMRFALMEAKVALAKLVLAVEMETAPGHENLDIAPGAGLMKPNKVHLVFNSLKEE